MILLGAFVTLGNLASAICNTPFNTVSLGDLTIPHGTTPYDFSNSKTDLNEKEDCFNT